MPLMTKPQIQFDVNNPEHVAAVQRSIQTGKLDPRFRFVVEEGFSSAMSMAIYKMAEAWMKMTAVSGKVPTPDDQSAALMFKTDPAKVVMFRGSRSKTISRQNSLPI